LLSRAANLSAHRHNAVDFIRAHRSCENHLALPFLGFSGSSFRQRNVNQRRVDDAHNFGRWHRD
jgi:hypothetical protein